MGEHRKNLCDDQHPICRNLQMQTESLFPPGLLENVIGVNPSDLNATVQANGSIIRHNGAVT